MNPEDVLLLKTLAAALHGSALPEEVITPGFFECAQKQKVLPLLYDVLDQHVDDSLQKVLQAETDRTILQFWHLFAATHELCDLFTNSNIKTAVLKGISAARMYPVMETRKSGDIDLLVLPEAMEKVTAVMAEHGYRKSQEQDALHHVAFHGPQGLEVEVHTLFAEPFDNEAANRLLAEYSRSALDHVESVAVEGVSFPFLEDEYQAFSLLVHMLQDYLRAGCGLKLLADWVVFWEKRSSSSLKESYLTMIRAFGAEGFHDVMTSACIYYLGLDSEAAPCTLCERDLAEQFLADVAAGGDFGRSSSERMVSLRGSGIFDYLREFHHQTCLNYPNSSHVLPILPVLWGMTLIKFLVNNHSVRHTSLMKVLRSTHARSKLNEQMHLFQNESR